jgi:hypothetical protein
MEKFWTVSYIFNLNLAEKLAAIFEEKRTRKIEIHTLHKVMISIIFHCFIISFI